MGHWQIVIPRATRNLLRNPSAERGTTHFVPYLGSSMVERVPVGVFGGYGLYVWPDGAHDYAGVLQSVAAADVPTEATVCVFSCWIRGTLPGYRYWIDLRDNVGYSGVEIVTTGEWQRVEVAHTMNWGATALQAGIMARTPSQPVFTDAWQIETAHLLTSSPPVPILQATTYCDGDQDGCVWEGAAHNSISRRSVTTRQGGHAVDLADEFNTLVRQAVGAGMASVAQIGESYGLLPGDSYQRTAVRARRWGLAAWIDGDTYSDLRRNRARLIDVLKPDRVPGEGSARLVYRGAETPLHIDAYYEAGLAAEETTGFGERLALRFYSPDPFWYGETEERAHLATLQALPVRYIAGRVSGAWDGLGPPASVGGTPWVRAMVMGPDGRLYIGGTFTDWAGNANADYIAVWNPQTQSWSNLGSGTNGTVWDMAFHPDGSLYVVGEFTLAGGVANTARVARWNGSAWSALGTGLNGSGFAVAIGGEGAVYVGGAFTSAGGVADTRRFARWSGSQWEALETGLYDGAVYALHQHNGWMYLAGTFTTDGLTSRPIRSVARWWSGRNQDMLQPIEWVGNFSEGQTLNAIVVGGDGTVYIGGNNLSYGYVARLAGNSWVALGAGLSGPRVRALAVRGNGELVAGGSFASAGGLYLADSIARWDGSSWKALDIDLPGSAEVYGLLAHGDDLYVGFNTAGDAMTAAESPTVHNSGTTDAYPRIVIRRSGGTSAVLESIRNETTGDEMMFDLLILDGETITIDLRPRRKVMRSDFRGTALGDNPRPGSDDATWRLAPGLNQITVKMNESAAPGLECYMVWRPAYWSFDGAPDNGGLT